MKVSQVMKRPLFTVSPQTPLSEVRRLIFSLGISSIYATKDKKLVGVISEDDILKYISPTVEEALNTLEDSQTVSSEKIIEDLLSTSAVNVMTPIRASVNPHDSLSKAQALMKEHTLRRLPVVDAEENIVGIVSYGDILRFLMKTQMSKLHASRYAQFIAHFHDAMVNWENRYEEEFPTLLKVFKKEKVERVLDLVTWTGEYSLELVRQGVKRLVGLDDQPLLVEYAEKKREVLPPNKRDKVKFMYSDFTNFGEELQEKFDAAILMGNSLSYINAPLSKTFKQIYKVLDENGVLIIQVINYDKLMKQRDGLLSFKTKRTKGAHPHEHLFVEFIDEKTGGDLEHNIINFDFNGDRWIYKGTNTIPIRHLSKETIEKALNDAGFSKISIGGNIGSYQGDHGKLSFTKPYDAQESDWMNILAKK